MKDTIVKLTKEAAKEYFETGSVNCPYCGGKETMQHNESDLENHVLVYMCYKCYRSVEEYFKVYGVSGDEEQRGDPFVFDESALQDGEKEIEVLFHRIVYWWRDGYETPVGEEEFIKERVKDCILDDFNEGELQYYDDKEVQHSGWWRIQK